MSSHVAAARLAEFKDAFKLLDKDGDGTISWLEFEGFLRSIGQTPTKQDLEVCAACACIVCAACVHVAWYSSRCRRPWQSLMRTRAARLTLRRYVSVSTGRS